MQKTFNKGHPEKLFAPLALADIAGVESELESPRDGKENGIPRPLEAGSDEYLEELHAAAEARVLVERGVWPAKYFAFCGMDHEPSQILLDAGIDKANPQDACRFVQMDAPEELFRACINWLNGRGVPLRWEQPNVNNFLERNVHSLLYFAQLNSETMEIIFEAKSAFLQPRPEENMGMYYPSYGCPNHGEDPTGHGGFAGCVAYACKGLYRMKEYEWDEILHTCRMLAHLRDIAGMHLRTATAKSVQVGLREIGPATNIVVPDYFTRWPATDANLS